MNKFRIVKQGETSGMTVMEFTFTGVDTATANENFVRVMHILGFKHTGNNDNKHQREELQGTPKFYGLLGAMWDGDAIRYEDQAAYNTLSA